MLACLFASLAFARSVNQEMENTETVPTVFDQHEPTGNQAIIDFLHKNCFKSVIS